MTPCKMCHPVWRVAQESVDKSEPGLPLDFAGIANMVSACVHCGRVSKRWTEKLDLGRAQAEASQHAHDGRCRRPRLPATGGRWLGAGERMA